MTCEMPLRPKEIAEFSHLEPVCPNDLPTPATELVEQKIPPARWETRWEEGECEVWGNSTIVYLHEAAKNLTR